MIFLPFFFRFISRQYKQTDCKIMCMTYIIVCRTHWVCMQCVEGIMQCAIQFPLFCRAAHKQIEHFHWEISSFFDAPHHTTAIERASIFILWTENYWMCESLCIQFTNAKNHVKRAQHNRHTAHKHCLITDYNKFVLVALTVMMRWCWCWCCYSYGGTSHYCTANSSF